MAMSLKQKSIFHTVWNMYQILTWGQGRLVTYNFYKFFFIKLVCYKFRSYDKINVYWKIRYYELLFETTHIRRNRNACEGWKKKFCFSSFFLFTLLVSSLLLLPLVSKLHYVHRVKNLTKKKLGISFRCGR